VWYETNLSIFPFQLITNSLHVVISTDGVVTGRSLIHYLAALHIAYHKNKAKIEWFSQLVSFNPGIMISLKSTVSRIQHRSEMVSLARKINLRWCVLVTRNCYIAIGVAFACCG
jgi:tetrahydromethanopterin S-methyltransferase subunit F